MFIAVAGIIFGTEQSFTWEVWCLLALAIGMVLEAERANTALENFRVG